MQKLKDLTGKRFGKLLVMKLAGKLNNRAAWLCKCDCGNLVIVRGNSLKSGDTKSCGCLLKEKSTQRATKHNLRFHRLYTIFQMMKQRCYNPKATRYDCYGGRGIRIHDKWLNDFKTFYNWAMNNGYKDNLTIDRIDVNGNYEPCNCRWATYKEQNSNKRNNKKEIM